MERVTLRLIFDRVDYLNDVAEIPRAFSPYLHIDEESENYLEWHFSQLDNNFSINISSSIWESKNFCTTVKAVDFTEYKRITKRFIKNSLYVYLSDVLHISLPYGSLTGVRPTKMYYELSKNLADVKSYLCENLFVSPKKAQLIENCVINQKNVINTDPKTVGVFLNIPFCPSRCSYCSFISTEVFRIRKELPLYVECVKKELNMLSEILQINGFSVGSIYVGGGTPTCIGADNLSEFLKYLKDFGCEFTVEAGRPDTISEDYIKAFSVSNVTRISVNPQTFKQSTLDLIGRKHTLDDVYRCFELLRNTDFSINTDLIAGLPEESYDDFCDSIRKAIALSPDNITVHALSLKRGSVMTLNGDEKKEFGLTSAMIESAYELLSEAGFLPYYMYRQKNTADNLENTGYCKPGKQCKYNVDMMEEAAGIIAFGAGAMSKLIVGNRIERLSNPKGFREYCERIDDIVEKKRAFFGI